MAKAVSLRLVGGLLTLLGVAVGTFLLIRLLPADPAAFLASGPGMGPAEVAALRAHLGLDVTLPRQLGHFIRAILHGDWGVSFTTGQPVLRDLAQRLPASLALSGVGMSLALIVAGPLGVIAAHRPHSWLDRVCQAVAGVAGAIPSFILGLGLIAVFYGQLDWVPLPVGWNPPTLAGLLLPSMTVAGFGLGPLLRLTRASVRASVDSEAILMARAVGLSPRMILWRYTLPMASLPLLAGMTSLLASVIAASVVVETVFAWPGLGRYAVNAVINADYAALEGFVILNAALMVGLSWLSEGAGHCLDPRKIS